MSGILQPRCPAAELVQPVTSSNPRDALCRIAGHLQPVQGSPCCDGYVDCKIWRSELDRTRFLSIAPYEAAPVVRGRRPTRADTLVGPKI